MKKTILPFLLTITLSTLLVSFINGPKITNAAPKFEAKTSKGEEVSTDKLKGQVVVIHIFATWNNPCLNEFSKLNEFRNKYVGRNVRFLSITDEDSSKVGTVFRAKGLKLDYDLITSREDIVKEFSKAVLKDFNQGPTKKIESKPTHIVIDQKGNVVFFFKGISPTITGEMKLNIDRCLASKMNQNKE